jgi:hypothetical protein
VDSDTAIFTALEYVEPLPMFRQVRGFKKLDVDLFAIIGEDKRREAKLCAPTFCHQISPDGTGLPMPPQRSKLMVIGLSRGERSISRKAAIYIHAL